MSEDVQIKILYCGVCHSDVHQARDEVEEMMPTVYPCVPGHEIVGARRAGRQRCLEVEGKAISSLSVAWSPRRGTRANCKAGPEQFCVEFATFTYNAPDKDSGGVTYGGYSDSIVVDEHFVLRGPSALDPAPVAPLLCAGITTYSPLRRWGRGRAEGRRRRPRRPGPHGGEVRARVRRARGAVHHLAAQGGRRWRLGADEVVVSRDPDEMRKHASSFDFILDTASPPRTT